MTRNKIPVLVRTIIAYHCGRDATTLVPDGERLDARQSAQEVAALEAKLIARFLDANPESVQRSLSISGASTVAEAVDVVDGAVYGRG